VLLVRGGAVLPHAAAAQHTGAIDWSRIDLRVYGAVAEARGFFALPDGDLQTLVAVRRGASYALKADPLRGKVTWTFYQANRPNAGLRSTRR
jgi:alpha-D-xyloside xylohydrolase